MDSVVAVAPGSARTPNASATGPNALPSTDDGTGDKEESKAAITKN